MKRPITAGRLTERQCALLLTAARRGRVTSEVIGGRGQGGGRVSGGLRERATVNKLRDLGLLEHIGGYHEMESARGYTVHIWASHWHLTSAGRAVIES